MSGTVVNGGLIDFQDNLQRGVQEYVTPSMLLQAAANPQGMTLASGVGGQYPGAQSGFIQQGVAMPGGVLCGPASYLHVNGVTYKPVEEPNSKLSTAPTSEPAKPPAGRTYAEVVSEEPAPRMLSKRELQQAIDERVKAQVKTYMRNQQADDSDMGAGVRARVSSTASYSPEDLAALRVADLNAGMPTGRAGGGKAGKGKAIQSRW